MGLVILCPVLAAPIQEQGGESKGGAVEGYQDAQGQEHMTQLERLKVLALLILAKKRPRTDL